MFHHVVFDTSLAKGIAQDMKPHGLDRGLDATALKRKFPSHADSSLHYLDNVATARMPSAVLGAHRRFDLEARANVHDSVHRLGRALPRQYMERHVGMSRAFSMPIPSRRSSLPTARRPRSISSPFRLASCSGLAMTSCCRFSSMTATSCPGKDLLSDQALYCVF